MAVKGKEEVLKYASQRKEVNRHIKNMIVDQLCLDMDPRFITDDQPLFGRGLELDSIDSLELAVGIYNEYQLSLSDDDTKIFSSVNAMADYVMENAELNDNDNERMDLTCGFTDLG